MSILEPHLCGKKLVSITNSGAGQWLFHFGGEACLNAAGFWRILSSKRIVVTSEDDGQRFGLPAPIDAQAEAEKAIRGATVTAVDWNSGTGDLTISFESGIKLEALNLSSGYEAWIFTDEGHFLVVGRNE